MSATLGVVVLLALLQEYMLVVALPTTLIDRISSLGSAASCLVPLMVECETR